MATRARTSFAPVDCVSLLRRVRRRAPVRSSISAAASRSVAGGREQVVQGAAQLWRQHLVDALDQALLASCHGGRDQRCQSVLARKLDAPLREQVETAPEDQLRPQVGHSHRIDVDDQFRLARAFEPAHAMRLEDRKLVTLSCPGRIEAWIEQVR